MLDIPKDPCMGDGIPGSPSLPYLPSAQKRCDDRAYHPSVSEMLQSKIHLVQAVERVDVLQTPPKELLCAQAVRLGVLLCTA